MLRLVLILALILPISVALVLFTFALAHAEVSGPALVIDGDTIEISGERIRLHGIDTPKANQTCLNDFGKRWQCGREATLTLKALIRDHSITCKGAERDKYRRLIAVCFAGLTDLNAEMVRRGWALAYQKYSTDYVADEADAKAKKLGLWTRLRNWAFGKVSS